MAKSEGADETLAGYSYEELGYIFSWSAKNEEFRQGDLVLIGGWAVHSYNPWKYSLDIDFLSTNRFKDLLKEHLYTTMGYEKEKDSFGNTVLLKNAPPGEIYLDFLPKQDMFHNTQVYLDIGKLSYQTTSRKIQFSSFKEYNVIIPEISMLLLLKVKAAWDRYNDIQNVDSANIERLTEKFSKDCGDIIALMDCDDFRFARFEWLSPILKGYHFLKEFIEEGNIEQNSPYSRLSISASKTVIKNFLSVI